MRKSENLKYWSFQKENGLPEQVSVPHDWAVSGPFDRSNDNQNARIVQDGECEASEHNGRTGGLPHVGKGIYSCEIPGPADSGRQVFLDFDGVMSHAKVFINGIPAGSRNYGYSSFRIDAGKYLTEKKNSLEVHVENFPNSSRWYPGAGIYRRVRRVETDPVFFAHWGIRIQYSAQQDSLLLTAEICNRTGHSIDGVISIRSELFSPVAERCVVPSEGMTFSKNIPLGKYRNWSVEDPVLYKIDFRIEADSFSDEEILNCHEIGASSASKR